MWIAGDTDCMWGQFSFRRLFKWLGKEFSISPYPRRLQPIPRRRQPILRRRQPIPRRRQPTPLDDIPCLLCCGFGVLVSFDAEPDWHEQAQFPAFTLLSCVEGREVVSVVLPTIDRDIVAVMLDLAESRLRAEFNATVGAEDEDCDGGAWP